MYEPVMCGLTQLHVFNLNEDNSKIMVTKIIKVNTSALNLRDN